MNTLNSDVKDLLKKKRNIIRLSNIALVVVYSVLMIVVPGPVVPSSEAPVSVVMKVTVVEAV